MREICTSGSMRGDWKHDLFARNGLLTQDEPRQLVRQSSTLPCREGGFIAIGWDELGDVSKLSRPEFEARRDELIAQHADWAVEGVEQVWRFAREIKEGDQIVANRGTTEVLGIGTVIGVYEFVPGIRHGHHLPVEWNDLTPRQVDEYGWRRTMVKLDRKKFLEVSSAPPVSLNSELAAPFAQIFTSREEAEWAFDFLKETLDRLGVKGPDDVRFAITLRHDAQVLRLNFGSWAVLQFYSPSSSQFRVGVALIEEQANIEGEYDQWGPFAQEEPVIRVYELPIEKVRPLQGSLRQVYENTFASIADGFQHWKASNLRKFNQPEIAEAVFDPAKRERLFSVGLGPKALSSVEVDQPDWPDETARPAYFTSRTFELLAGLHAAPTKEFYQAHKEEFKTCLESPFQQLFHDVAAKLPSPITDVMETRSRIFARILKNDWGQGRAWPHYWGAFYPKGGKRTEGAQLFAGINHERLEFGFSIGEYGSKSSQRFLDNCQKHRDVLLQALRASLDDATLAYGKSENAVGSGSALTWENWLEDPGKAGIRVSAVIPNSQMLEALPSELVQQASQVFERLFPLVLLATFDEPMAEIEKYLGASGKSKPEHNPEYPLDECARQTGFDQATLVRWVRAIERKGQAIVYGPPGTGKTYLAEQLAKHLIGGGDGFCELVQFHPAYAYEDFIQGIRPQRTESGLDYPMVSGRFLDFCNKAKSRQGRCVLVIDEINRANLARVFGELMYLLEYRDQVIPLAGGGVLRIPANVRIIGTMNTADRSIALVDHALRRRFAFLALYPNYEILRRYHAQIGFSVEGLIQTLQHLNRQIGDRHYEVGITFFLRRDLPEQLPDIWAMEIEPYLEEYFFDQPDRAAEFRWDRIKDQVIL